MFNLELTPIQRIMRARLQLQGKAYFIYSILFKAKYRMAEGKMDEVLCPVKTAYADSLGNIVVFADYIRSKSDSFVEAVVYHEAMHLVLKHPVLCKGRNVKVWNIAADIKSNQYVAEAGYSIPTEWHHARGGYYSEDLFGVGIAVHDCNQKSSLRIYEEIMEQLHGSGKGQAMDQAGSYGQPGKSGAPSDPEDGVTSHHGWGEGTDAEIDQLSRQLDDLIRGAYESAKAIGKMPGSLEREVQEVLIKKKNWKSLIQIATTREIPRESCYSFPHKKSVPCGIYLPHIRKEGIEIIASFDTSGSMSQQELNEARSHMILIARQCPQINMTVLVCDAAIHGIYPVRNGHIKDIMKIKMHGGGGTNHRPIYEWCKCNKKNVKLLINFTDGYTSFPRKKDVTIKTLWVLTRDGVPSDRIPFGRVIRM